MLQFVLMVLRVISVSELLYDDQLDKVPFFLKQLGAVVTYNGTPMSFGDSHAGSWDEWPKEFRVRELTRLQATERSRIVNDGANAREDDDAKDLAGKRRRAALKAWETRRAREAALREG